MELVHGVPVIGDDRLPSESVLGAAAATRGPPRKEALHSLAISQSAVAPPLDFSFQDIADLDELKDHEPAGGRKPSSAPTSPSGKAQTLQVLAASGATGGDSGARAAPKATVTGVRLAYNELKSLRGLVAAMELLLGPDAKTQLTWLDLSHNKLTQIEDVLFAFPNLSSLYLHGNPISSLAEVRKLSVLSHLSKLTLHGTLLYQEKHNHGLRNPRSGVIFHLRTCPLKSLDFITVTNSDRRNALRWSEQNKPKKRRSKAAGDSPERRG